MNNTLEILSEITETTHRVIFYMAGGDEHHHAISDPSLRVQADMAPEQAYAFSYYDTVVTKTNYSNGSSSTQHDIIEYPIVYYIDGREPTAAELKSCRKIVTRKNLRNLLNRKRQQIHCRDGVIRAITPGLDRLIEAKKF